MWRQHSANSFIKTSSLAFSLAFISLVWSTEVEATDQDNLSDKDQVVQMIKQHKNILEILDRQLAKLVPDSIETSETLDKKSVYQFNLAALYLDNKQYHKAIDMFDQHIKLIKLREGVHSVELLDPLASQAIALYKLKDFSSSLNKLQEVQHLIHRSEGVWSMTQAPFVTWIANTHLAMSKVKTADKMQRFHYTLHQKNYPKGSPELVPPLLELARWFRTSGQYHESTISYEDALTIVTNHNLSAKQHNETLSGMAKTLYLNNKCCPDKALAKAARLLEQDDASDPYEVQLAYLEAADMSLLVGNGEQGNRFYQHAATFTRTIDSPPRMLGATRITNLVRAYRPNFDNEYYTRRTDNFTQKERAATIKLIGSPLPICTEELRLAVRHRDYSKYIVDLDFEVLPDGRPSNVSISSSNAPAAVNQLIRRMLKMFRFRPKLVDGIPITEHMAFRQTFNNNERDLSKVAELASEHTCHLLASL